MLLLADIRVWLLLVVVTLCLFFIRASELIKLPFASRAPWPVRHTGNVGCIHPTGCQKVFHCFLLAVGFGISRIGGNGLSSGIAGVKGQDDRERKRERFCCFVTTNYNVKKKQFSVETAVPRIQWSFQFQENK